VCERVVVVVVVVGGGGGKRVDPGAQASTQKDAESSVFNMHVQCANTRKSSGGWLIRVQKEACMSALFERAGREGKGHQPAAGYRNHEHHCHQQCR
jgi:hypothetical protein